MHDPQEKRRRAIAVLGAGPIGLEAALHAVTLGHAVTVYEAGRAGEAMRRWGHVRMFSPWRMNRSALGAGVVDAAMGSPPGADACPTGAEYVERYLEPLAASLSGCLRTHVRVVAVSRRGLCKSDRVGDPSRATEPFRLLLRDRDGERVACADVVIDATGTYGNPNRVGDGGIPAPGEAATEEAGRIARHLEDYEGTARPRYAGRRTLVVGSGYSAATAIRSLARLAAAAAGTEVLWSVRTQALPPLTPVQADPLPERARLTAEANRLALEGAPGLRDVAGCTVDSLEVAAGGVRVRLRGARGMEVAEVDQVVSLTGYGPDRALLGELQVHECYATGGPMKLAAALQSGDCLSQPETGPDVLRNPEPDLFVVGARLDGRNPAFLLRNGLAQVRDVFRILEEDATLDLGAGSPRSRMGRAPVGEGR